MYFLADVRYSSRKSVVDFSNWCLGDSTGKVYLAKYKYVFSVVIAIRYFLFSLTDGKMWNLMMWSSVVLNYWWMEIHLRSPILHYTNPSLHLVSKIYLVSLKYCILINFLNYPLPKFPCDRLSVKDLIWFWWIMLPDKIALYHCSGGR